jgi:ankyrin repeat protein
MAVPDPFSLARHNRFDELKQLLVDRAIDVNQRDAKLNTLLLVACQNGT